MTKQEFNMYAVNEHPNSEIAAIVTADPDCCYYELCQSFLDIALNAQKYRNQNGELIGVFQFIDINKAKQKAKEFLAAYHIGSIDKFFSVLKQDYPSSVSSDDTRQKAGWVNEGNVKFVGYIGTLYDFTRISDEIYEKVVEEIKA